MVASLLIGGAGIFSLSMTLSPTSVYLTLVPGLLVAGIGQGAGYTLMFGVASHGVAPAQQGVAAGLASTTQQIGGAAGLALLTALTDTNNGTVSSAVHNIRLALITIAIGVAVTVIVALIARNCARTT